MIWGILALGFMLRLISLDQSLWFDEGINVIAAKSYSLLGILTQYAVADFHPPGWFIILWVWGKIFGYSESLLRLPSVIFGVITVYFTYLVGRKLVSLKVGLVAALLLSINPLHIYYSQEARMYSLATLAVAVNIYLFAKIIKEEKLNILLLIISNLFILLSDYVAYFIFPAQLVCLIMIKKADLVKKWAMGITGALILNIFWWPVFINQLDTGATASAELPTWKFVAGGFDVKALPLTFVKIIIGRISIANKFLYAVLLMPVGILFAYLILNGIKKMENKSKILLLCWVIVPLLTATIISLVIPVYSYFRVLYIIPGFLILTSVGILSFSKRLKAFFLSVVIFIELLCALAYLMIPSNQREDWKGLVAFLRNKKAEVVLFESSGTFPAFEYYSQNSLNTKGALKDFPASDETVVAELGDLINIYNEVYLVDYLVEISDPKRFVAKKLSELKYKLEDTTDFHGVGFVYRYVKNDSI